MDPGTVYVSPAPSNNYGAWALALVIVVIIVIIILAVLLFRDAASASGLINGWTIQQGATTTPEAFIASPNTVYIANSGMPPGMIVTINPFPDLNSVVVGTRGTEFQISNNLNATNSLTVNTTSGITFIPGTPSPGTVLPGTTATYLWVTPTTIQRLS